MENQQNLNDLNTVDNNAINGGEVPEDKSAEQLASEFNLDSHIPDESSAINSDNGQAVNNQSPVNVQEAISGVLTVIPMGLTFGGLKNAAAVWSGDVRDGVSAALIPVLQKYTFGQKMLAYLSSGGGVAEGVLLLTLLPICQATYQAAQYDIALMNEAKKEAEKEAANDDVTHSADSPLGSTFKFKSES